MMIQSKFNAVRKFAFALLMSGFVLIGGTGCDLLRNQLKTDRDANMEIQDFRDGLASRFDSTDQDEATFNDSSIPELQPYLAESHNDVEPMPLVSISVNQSIPLRDVLFELARQAEYDLELDPSIEGAVIFTARERPFDEVVERISEMAGLRYRFRDDAVLRVELDHPYNKVYKIDYLSYIRRIETSVRSDLSVVSGEGADTGSAYETTSESESDFWGELERSLTQIMGGRDRALITRRDPIVSAAAPNDSQQSEVERSFVIETDQLALDALEEEEAQSDRSLFSINRQAGLINVYGSEKVQREVGAYLGKVKRAVTAQVLIEAKIIEVALSDEYDAGVDWNVLQLLSGDGVLQFGSAAGVEASTGRLGTTLAGSLTNVVNRSLGSQATGNDFIIGHLGNDVQALVRALSEFGTTRALASPRLTVLNNQAAILNVANNRVFFEVEIDVTTDEGVTQTDIDSDIRNVPEGVLVNVQPSIDLDNQTISMALRPTITRVIREVNDPAVQFVAAQAGVTGVESLIPEVNVQEIDSVIQLRSGQPIVMGGLLQDRSATVQGGVPIAAELPVVGSLFRSQNDLNQKTELVILLKATIVEGFNNIHQTDRDIYKRFSGDRRPFKL